MLQNVRRLGKRVAIASIKGACSSEYSDPVDRARVRDLEILWLEDLLPRLARRYDPHWLECQSPAHKGVRRVETTYYPKRGEKFYPLPGLPRGILALARSRGRREWREWRRASPLLPGSPSPAGAGLPAIRG